MSTARRGFLLTNIYTYDCRHIAYILQPHLPVGTLREDFDRMSRTVRWQKPHGQAAMAPSQRVHCFN